jgi:hypothetical protein
MNIVMLSHKAQQPLTANDQRTSTAYYIERCSEDKTSEGSLQYIHFPQSILAAKIHSLKTSTEATISV